MPDPQLTHRRAIGAAIVVTILWSSSWILVRVGLDDENLAPLTFAGLRYAVAAVVLLSWVGSRPHHRTELKNLDRPALQRLAALGFVFVAVTQGAQFVAIDNQPAATTSLVLAPTALFVAVVSAFAIGERSSRLQFVGSLLVVVGAGVYFAGDLGATVIGMLAAVTALVANVTGALLGRSVNRQTKLPAVVVTAVSMSVGSSLLLAAGIAIEGWPTISLRLALIVGWLAVVNTAMAFTLWNRSMRVLAAVESAAINNTMLVQIALLAWLFLGESPGPVGAVGIVVVTLGALLTTSFGFSSRIAESGPGSVRLVLATDNPAKRSWMADALTNTQVVLHPGVTAVDVEENGSTCVANAVLKAKSVGPREGCVVAAEDSGLFVDGLGGFPGTHTARWMDGSDDDRARALVAKCVGLLGSDRTARFESVVVLLFPDGRVETHHGALEGRIAEHYEGVPGDGYGAVFDTTKRQTRRHNDHVNTGDHRDQALSSAARSLNLSADQVSHPHISTHSSTANVRS
jgi:non-canonical purine NTP pyrophosphatase (RdgB/HAM1 family)